MTREQIERLAMDHAAGELNADAEALLEQYLRGHPDAKSWADEIAAAYLQAETAIVSRVDDVEPPAGPLAHRARSMNVNCWPVLTRAAVVLFAVVFGFVGGRMNVHRHAPLSTARLLDGRETQKEGAGWREIYEDGFWGSKVAGLMQAKAYYAQSRRTADGRFWQGVLTQTKEKRNE